MRPLGRCRYPRGRRHLPWTTRRSLAGGLREAPSLLYALAVDAWLAIASKRDLRDYDGTPLAPEDEELILDAGRLAGSAANRQPWRFVVVVSPTNRERLADAVYEPRNVRTAGFVVAVLAPARAAFDCGRAAQNMMLAAWNVGIASCPNGIADRDAARALLGPKEQEDIHIVLSFGRPTRPRRPEERSPAEWSARAKRKPLAALVTRI